MFDPDAILTHPPLRNLIRSLARPSRVPDALACDGGDVAQELRLSYLQAARIFDPTRGSPQHFAAFVLARTARGHRRRCGQRARRRTREPLEAPEELADFRSHGDGDLRIDLMRAITSLPDDLLELAIRLLAGTVAEIARERGISRSTLVRRIEKLRVHFEKAGLDIYV